MIAATTGPISPAWESFEASNAKWRMSRRVGPRIAARPVRLAGAFCGERCRGRRAGAACGALSRARGGAALARRHAHGAQYAGLGLCRRRHPADAGRGRSPATVSVVLEHKDPALALPLFVSAEADEAFAEWRTWGQRAGSAVAGSKMTAPCASRSRAWGSVRVERATPAPAPPQCDQAPPAVDAVAPQGGQAHRRHAGASRRARDHRQELIHSPSSPAKADDPVIAIIDCVCWVPAFAGTTN